MFLRVRGSAPRHGPMTCLSGLTVKERLLGGFHTGVRGRDGSNQDKIVYLFCRPVWCPVNRLACGVTDLSFPRVASARGIPDSGRLFQRSSQRHGVSRFNQRDCASGCHLLALALADNSLVDVVEFFRVDEPLDVIASQVSAPCTRRRGAPDCW